MKNKVVYEAKINKAATNLVMNMLSELYDNPEAAILREYVDNAYNANTDAKATKPVEVHLPEKKAPYLSIKDYCDGLDSTSIIAMFADFEEPNQNDDELITDNIVRKLPNDIYEKIQFIAMVHDVPIGELKVNYAREKLDVSEQTTIKKTS